MKLLQCLACRDMFSLRMDLRRCDCGQSGGYYLPDGLWAEYYGPARLIGLRNQDLKLAEVMGEQQSLSIRQLPPDTWNPHYVWWVIPEGEHCIKIDGEEPRQADGSKSQGAG